MLHNHTEDNLANLFGIEELRPKLIAQHYALYEAIKKSHAKEAAELAYEHIDFISISLKSQAEKQKRDQISLARAEQERKRAQKK